MKCAPLLHKPPLHPAELPVPCTCCSSLRLLCFRSWRTAETLLRGSVRCPDRQTGTHFSKALRGTIKSHDRENVCCDLPKRSSSSKRKIINQSHSSIRFRMSNASVIVSAALPSASATPASYHPAPARRRPPWGICLHAGGCRAAERGAHLRGTSPQHLASGHAS